MFGTELREFVMRVITALFLSSRVMMVGSGFVCAYAAMDAAPSSAAVRRLFLNAMYGASEGGSRNYLKDFRERLLNSNNMIKIILSFSSINLNTLGMTKTL